MSLASRSGVLGATLLAIHERELATAASPYWLRYLGDPILTTPCTPIDSVADIPAGLLDAMRAVCRGELRARVDARTGLGLAANQVGATIALCVVTLADEPTMRVLLNPRITDRSAERAWGPEGCLSIPGFEASIPRHRAITVTYRDLAFLPQTLRLAGLSARVVQHEVDHLAGRLIVDGLSRQLKRQAERAAQKAAR